MLNINIIENDLHSRTIQVLTAADAMEAIHCFQGAQEANRYQWIDSDLSNAFILRAIITGKEFLSGRSLKGNEFTHIQIQEVNA